jgi:hypothetical protein
MVYTSLVPSHIDWYGIIYKEKDTTMAGTVEVIHDDTPEFVVNGEGCLKRDRFDSNFC